MQEKYNYKTLIPKKNSQFLKIMKIHFLITLFCVFSVTAENSYAQSRTVTVEFNHITLKEALHQIEKNSDYLFLIMDEAEEELSERVNLSYSNKSITALLDELLEKTNLTYAIVNRQITIARKERLAEAGPPAEASPERVVQQTRKTITGTVVDINGESVIGANIIEVGTPSNGTITDVNGRFTLIVSVDASVQISYIGYLSQTINTTGRTTFHITLVEDTQSLEEVVVVG